MIKNCVDRGADAAELATWLARISDRSTDEAAMIRAAEDIQRGGRQLIQGADQTAASQE